MTVDLVDLLLNISRSKFGRVVLGGYTVATFVTLLIAGSALLELRAQGRQLHHQQQRSCQAIRGATQYWVGVRIIVNEDFLRDPQLPPKTREGMRSLSVLLDGVISAADILSCGKEVR
jgi:hypothetical protein